MSETDVTARGDSQRPSADTDEPMFEVGPPQPVTDSRLLPAVAPEEEEAFVHGADLAEEHPDNAPLDADMDIDAPAGDMEDEDEDLPGEDELDDLVAGVDTEDIDPVGFDEGDLAELTGAGTAGDVRAAGREGS